MGRQMKAEREKRAVILEAEGLRASAILKAEGEKQSAILSAEGTREAAFRSPRPASAPPRPRRPRPRWSPTRSRGAASQAINYFIAQKYVEAIGLFARSPNAKTILFPIEATQLIGTLGGIGELAKEAFGRGGPPPSPPDAVAPPPVRSEAGRK
jgi:regulator of protease activity HflC (stomatin/prohibitin superfamily)